MPDGAFDGLTSLRVLSLGGNQLTELPDGIFEGLSSLETLRLDGNPGDPFILGLELEKRGSSAVVVKTLKGTPSDVEVTLSARRAGEQPQTLPTVLMEAGTTTSEEVDISQVASGYSVAVTVESAAFRGEPDFWGIPLGLGAPLVLTGSNIGDSPAIGVPTISGIPHIGQTLTLSTSGISDAEGLSNATFSYQWTASDGTTDGDIQNATNDTYAPAQGDIARPSRSTCPSPTTQAMPTP